MPDYLLDITDQKCPMTFVRTRLLWDRMKAGESAEVHLAAGEPLENVPRSLKELGQNTDLIEEIGDGIWRLVFTKA